MIPSRLLPMLFRGGPKLTFTGVADVPATTGDFQYKARFRKFEYKARSRRFEYVASKGN